MVDTTIKMSVFSPAGAKAGAGTSQLCIRNNGMLLLLGKSGGWPLLLPPLPLLLPLP